MHGAFTDGLHGFSWAAANWADKGLAFCTRSMSRVASTGEHRLLVTEFVENGELFQQAM